MKTSEKFAVYMGRFQPFHSGHSDVILEIANKFDNIIILIGEQKGDDPLTFEQRANFFKEYLKDRFTKFAIMPMYDYDDWDKWATEAKKSASEVSDNITLIRPRKDKDINIHGYHYLDYLEPWFPDVMDIEISNHDIHATDIRKNPKAHMNLIASGLRQYFIHGVGKRYKNHNIIDLHNESKWVQLKQHTRDGGTPFIFSHRRNKDSVAFIIRNTEASKIGLLIEQKPPVDVEEMISAFGGSFDVPNDNPYRIVNQEVLEESGITDFWPVYKGSYMASTQSSEVVHLFEIQTKQIVMMPQTTDVGEQNNRCIWMDEDDARYINDWRVQLILKD